MSKKVNENIYYPFFIIFSSIALYLYTGQDLYYYNIIKYFMPERTFYIIITTLIISLNSFILIQVVIRYFRIKRMLITRIGKRKYNLFLVKRLIVYVLMLSVTNSIIDVILFYSIDMYSQMSSILIGLIAIPFLKNDNFKQYNYVICILIMFAFRFVLSLFA